MENIKINTEYIRLDDLLKLVGAVESGGMAKFVIQNEKVFVDNEICTQRGKKLRENQIVKFNGEEFLIVK